MNILLCSQRYLKYEIGDLHWWVRKLDVRCASPPAFQGRMLSTLSEEEINDQSNRSCSLLTSEKHFCDARSPEDILSAPKVKKVPSAAKILVVTISTSAASSAGTIPLDSGLKSGSTKEKENDKKFSDDVLDSPGKPRALADTNILVFACFATIMIIVLLLCNLFRHCLSNETSSQNLATRPYFPVSSRNFVAVNQPTTPIDQRQDYLQPIQGPISCERDSGVCSQQNRSWVVDDHSYCSIQDNAETLPKRVCCSRSLSTERLSSVYQRYQKFQLPGHHHCRPNTVTHSGSRSRLANECRSFSNSRSSDEEWCPTHNSCEANMFVTQNRDCLLKEDRDERT